ncbi:ABC transporter substrate-binding protein [Pseudogulbenkiania sp. MAI-1]|uniref:ABC transporter substrate-binding protein n=1 Tax=Pseudogulbenkiania sp. MAI-1 TaxID=990370 RepID=UPI00045E7ED7|nr:ABC transporter substrate-binding protein [Pseudogulbenkiania sp. MAI-1]
MLRHTTAIAVFCALAASQAASAQDTVRLGNLKFAHYGAVSYMKEICGKYNIKVEERLFAKGTDIMPAIIADEIDVAASAADAAISARANGVPVYAVAGFAKGGARIIAQADSGIKSMRDLKGKKVGVTRGGAHELLLLAELEKNGLTWSDKPGKDVQIVYLAYADLNQALAGKQIDAMCQSEPQSSQALSKKFGVELLKPYDTAMGEPVRTLVMSEKLYNQRDVAGRLMKCFVEATSTFNKNPQLAEKYVRENLFKGQLSAEDFRDAMNNADYTYDVTALHLDVTTHFMQKYGVGRMAKPPKAVEWVKLDLLQQAKNELKVK